MTEATPPSLTSGEIEAFVERGRALLQKRWVDDVDTVWDAKNALTLALDALTSLKPSTAGWLPISTAPKDGRDVLGYGRRAVDGDDHHAIIRWSDLAQIWAVNCMPFYPTSWQPLIAPSQEGASEGEGSPAEDSGPV